MKHFTLIDEEGNNIGTISNIEEKDGALDLDSFREKLKKACSIHFGLQGFKLKTSDTYLYNIIYYSADFFIKSEKSIHQIYITETWLY